MRAAWSRKTDDELLHAFFLEELSDLGRNVVEQLVIEKVGPLDAYVARFASEQGKVLATFPVRGCEVTVRDLPVMWGYFVLATNGIGFVAEGLEEDSVAGLLQFGLGGLAAGLVASLAQTKHASVGASIAAAPLPLLASIEQSIVWIGRTQIDEVLWGPDFGEVICGGERVICADTTARFEDIVRSWAEAHTIPFAALEAAPLLR